MIHSTILTSLFHCYPLWIISRPLPTIFNLSFAQKPGSQNRVSNAILHYTTMEDERSKRVTTSYKTTTSKVPWSVVCLVLSYKASHLKVGERRRTRRRWSRTTGGEQWKRERSRRVRNKKKGGGEWDRVLVRLFYISIGIIISPFLWVTFHNRLFSL